MKDFILLTVSAIIVFCLSMIALSQWDKRSNYWVEHAELQREVNRLDKGLLELEIRADELDKAIVAHWRKLKGGRR